MTASISIPRSAPRHVARRAARDILPLAAAVVPFGTVVGVTLEHAGLTGPAALTGTALLYAGSAQLATLSVLIAGGGPLGAVLAGAIVNSRMLLYSAGLSGRFRHQPTWFRWLAPLTTVEQTFALATEVDGLDQHGFRQYWVTIGAVLGGIWLAAVSVGMSLGSVLPDHNPMEVAAPATMVALLMPHVADRRMRRVALVAAVIAVAGRLLPGGTGLVVAIVIGLVVAGPSATTHSDDAASPADPEVP